MDLITTLLLWLHLIGAAALLGTGAGIAFFMWMAHRTARPDIIAAVASIVVTADAVFTLPAVTLQPISGGLLAWFKGWPLSTGWIVLAVLLYIVTGLFWAPVVRMQARMRDLAREAVRTSTPLPEAYHQLARRWFACGVPAFAAVLAILWLMAAKPDIGW